MRILFFIFAGFCCGALAPALIFAEPLSQGSARGSPAAPSESLRDHLAEPTQDAQAQVEGGPTDGRQSHKAQDGKFVLDKGGQTETNEQLGTRRRPSEEWPDGQYSDQRQFSDQTGHGSAGKAKPRIQPNQGVTKPAAGTGEHSVGRRNDMNQAGLHHLAPNHTTGAPQFPAARQHNPTLPPASDQTPAALPVGPANNRSSTLSVIGGPTPTTATKSTAILNGTGLKHRP